MPKNDYIYRLLIAKASVTPDATGLSDIAEGELLVVDNTFTPLTSGDTVVSAPEIYVVQGGATGQGHKMSHKISGANITAFKGQSYAAAAEQVSYIGYNTAAGALNAANSTEYSIHIIFKHDKGLWSKRPAKRTYHYTSDGTATQQEIAQAFVNLMNNDKEFARQAIAATVNSGADYGIRVTGRAMTKQYIDDFEQVNFELAIDKGFSDSVPVDQYGYVEINGVKSTSNTASVSPSPGVGTFALVEDMERDQLGFNGVTNLIHFPVPNYPKYAVPGATYDMYVIEHFDRHETKDLTSKRDFPMFTIVAVESSNTAMTAYFEGIMNPYVASVGLPAVTL
jgi:hypothetical protein